MKKIASAQSLMRRHSKQFLFWSSLFVLPLLIAVFAESLCVGFLYVADTLRSRDTISFAQEHILTSPFASKMSNPAPGTHFLGHLRGRNDFWGWAQFLIADDLLGWRLASNVSAYYRDWFGHEVLFVTDPNGFSVDVNDPPITIEKSPDVYRVIVLGGSTVMGWGAPRPSQNIVAMLQKDVQERQLIGRNGRHVQFINAGIVSYNSAQEYLYFVSDLLRFEPDLVIVYDGWNDQLNALFRTEAHQELNQRLRESYSVVGSLSRAVQNLKFSLTEGDLRLGMVELPWRVLRSLQFHLFGDQSSDVSELPSSSAVLDPRNIEYYRINHRAFIALADDGLSVAVFLQPLVGIDDRVLSDQEKQSPWYPYLSEKLKSRISFYNEARSLLADFKERYHGNDHLCIADLSHSLRGVSEPVYADIGHLLPKGNEIVAKHMIDELVSCGLLGQRQ